MQIIPPNTTLAAGEHRFPIPIPTLEKRFNLELHFSGSAPAGSSAGIFFSDIDYDNIMAARGVTKPELVVSLDALTDGVWFAHIFPLYARFVWLRIDTPSPLSNVQARAQIISNAER